MKNVRLLLIFLVLLVLAGSSFASVNLSGVYGEGFSSAMGRTSNGISAGYQKVGTTETVVLSWRPNFKWGAWGLGMDFNAPIGNERPEGFESIVFRYAEYDDGDKGVRYGILENVTLGHGLLMDNYTTYRSSSIVPDNNDMGLKGYYKHDIYKASFMSTWSHVYAVEVSEQVYPWLVLGQYYVSDADGVTITENSGLQREYPSQSGIGGYALMPLWGGINGYVEAAKIFRYGKGYSAGIDWMQNLIVMDAAFNAEYRVLEKNFIPGYFGPEYETNPVNIASAAATSVNKNGYLIQFATRSMDLLNLNAIYEDYDSTDPSLFAEGTVKASDKVYVSAYFDQPNFASLRSVSLEDGAIIGGTLSYMYNPFTVIKTHYRKSYDAALGRVVETQYYEIELIF
ncbi:MAG: hypothetical protein ABIA63_14320 [bacterium]